MANLSDYEESTVGTGYGGTSLSDNDRNFGGVASVADGGTITHGMGAAPSSVVLTPSSALHNVAVTAVSGTTITVALKVISGGAAVSVAENVYWMATL